MMERPKKKEMNRNHNQYLWDKACGYNQACDDYEKWLDPEAVIREFREKFCHPGNPNHNIGLQTRMEDFLRSALGGK